MLAKRLRIPAIRLGAAIGLSALAGCVAYPGYGYAGSYGYGYPPGGYYAPAAVGVTYWGGGAYRPGWYGPWLARRLGLEYRLPCLE